MKIDVLLVEDDPQIAQLLVTVLTKMQFDVRHCSDGASGVAAYQERAPDVMLVDGLLPKKSGHDVCTEIRALPGGDKVGMILVSAAFRGAVARRDAYRAGFDAVFAKPFVVGDLVDAILTQAERYTKKRHESEGTIRRGLRKVASGAHAPIRPAAAAPRPMPHRAAAVAPPAAAPEVVAPVAAPVATSAAAPPRTATGTSSRAVSGPFARPAGASEPDGVARRHVTHDADALAWLLRSARARLSGIVFFEAGTFKARIAMLRGLVVGASDNLRENQLRGRLQRSGGLDLDALSRIDERMNERSERFLESAVALGLLSPRDAHHALRTQLKDRVRRAAQLDAGQVWFEEDTASAEAMYVEAVDLISCALDVRLSTQDADVLTPFLAEHGDKVMYPTADMEPGLIRYAERAPSSLLPQQLFVPNGTPRGIAQAVGTLAATDLVALYRVGLFTLTPRAQRAVPTSQDVDDGERLAVDEERAMMVQRELLCARGRDLYALLDVDPAASEPELRQALARAESRFGRTALAQVRLGDAKAAAQELWSYLDDARRIFSDATRRAEYDEQRAPDEGRSEQDGDRHADAAFLSARVRMNQGDFASARTLLEQACDLRPDDVELDSFRVWSDFRAGGVDASEATAELVMLHHRFPLASRPLLFLVDVAREVGNDIEAQAFQTLLLQLDPDDPEVRRRVIDARPPGQP